MSITTYGKKFYETVLGSIIPLKGYDDKKAENLEIFIEKKDPSKYIKFFLITIFYIKKLNLITFFHNK